MNRFSVFFCCSILFVSCQNSDLKNKINALQEELEQCQNGADKLYQTIINANELGDNESVKANFLLLEEKHPSFEHLLKARAIYTTILEKEEALKREEEKKQLAIKAEKEKALTRLKKKHDDVENITWYENTRFTHYTNMNGTSIYMGQKKGKKPYLRLMMSYKGDSWIFFKDAYLSYNGNTISVPFGEYKDKKSEVGYGHNVWEWIDINVNEDILTFLRKMVENGSGKMRLSGKYSETRNLSKNEIKGIKDILAGYDYLLDIKK